MGFKKKFKKVVKKVSTVSAKTTSGLNKTTSVIGEVTKNIPAVSKITAIAAQAADYVNTGNQYLQSAIGAYASSSSGESVSYSDDTPSVSASYDTQQYEIGSSGLEPVSMVKGASSSVPNSTLGIGAVLVGVLILFLLGGKKR